MNEWKNRILQGDVCDDETWKPIPDESVQAIITSPPYWALRTYNNPQQIGLEPTPEAYTQRLVSVFRHARRVLRDDGVLWLNLGDSYCGSHSGKLEDSKAAAFGTGATKVGMDKPSEVVEGLKPKDLVGIPWRVAFALQADGWWLRCDIIWDKVNSMVSSVNDRPMRSHEYIFLLSKSAKYYYDVKSTEEKGVTTQTRRKRTVWSVPTKGFHGKKLLFDFMDEDGVYYIASPDCKEHGFMANRQKCEAFFKGRKKREGCECVVCDVDHFAAYPTELIRPCVLASTKIGDIVLDPFFGSGTTGVVAKQEGRDYIGIELNHDYIILAEKWIAETARIFPQGEIQF